MDRIPPQNLEAEQAVLGSMMIERAAVEKATQSVGGRLEAFYYAFGDTDCLPHR